MKVNGNVMLIASIAALSFVAGRIGFPVGGGAVASAQDAHADPPAAHDERSMDTTPEMQAALEFGTPSERHRVLDQLVGTFSGEFTFRSGPDGPAMTTHGTVTREWILGGRFLREIVTAEGDMGGFEGVGFIGYDNFDGQYEMVWMDTTSTAIQLDTGNYHPDEQVMHIRETRRDPATGRLVNAWSKLDMSDPDRHLVIGNATDINGRTFRAMEGVLERGRCPGAGATDQH